MTNLIESFQLLPHFSEFVDSFKVLSIFCRVLWFYFLLKHQLFQIYSQYDHMQLNTVSVSPFVLSLPHPNVQRLINGNISSSPFTLSSTMIFSQSDVLISTGGGGLINQGAVSGSCLGHG